MKSETEIHDKINEINEDICKYNHLLCTLEIDKEDIGGETYLKMRNLYFRHIENDRDKIDLLLWVLK